MKPVDFKDKGKQPMTSIGSQNVLRPKFVVKTTKKAIRVAREHPGSNLGEKLKLVKKNTLVAADKQSGESGTREASPKALFMDRRARSASPRLWGNHSQGNATVDCFNYLHEVHPRLRMLVPFSSERKLLDLEPNHGMMAAVQKKPHAAGACDPQVAQTYYTPQPDEAELVEPMEEDRESRKLRSWARCIRADPFEKRRGEEEVEPPNFGEYNEVVKPIDLVRRYHHGWRGLRRVRSLRWRFLIGAGIA
uniref:Uncharacterized protein n=1 Tax=Cannabis sativa TaxID=3483 RepID=A0A803NT50_CANSA